MTTAVDMSEEHRGGCRTIAIQLLKGKVIPVLGAGANLCDRPPGTRWERGGGFLPSGHELAEALAYRYRMPEPLPGLAQVAQRITAEVGRGPLDEDLHSVFDADYRLSGLHLLLARISRYTRERLGRCMLFVTTNYDDSLERAFNEVGEEFELITYIADGEDRGRFNLRVDGAKPMVINLPKRYTGLRLEQKAVIAKIHGTVDRESSRDSFVITEDNYIDYLTRADFNTLLPVNLGKRLPISHFLFLGYGLQDWNMRVMMYRLWGQQDFRTYQSWAIQADPEPVELSVWRGRGVNILPIGCHGFVTEVTKFLDNEEA
jgi:hypothetical protein